MTYAQSQLSGASAPQPFITSYDLGYEYTQEHYIELQCLVEDADVEEATFAHVPQFEQVA